MDVSRLLDPSVRAHPIDIPLYRTIPRLTPRPARPGMITITNIRITPTGRVVPAYDQRGPGRIPRQLLINSRNWPVHLTQFNRESAEFTVPQPRPANIALLEEGRRISVDSSTHYGLFSSVTTGYCYPESDVGICNEPYHDMTEAPHGPSRRCTQCPTRLPTRLSYSSVQAGIVTTSLPDGQTLAPAICAKCVSLTTLILKCDYPVACSQTTAPLCDDCTMIYLCVRSGYIRDPTGLPPLNAPCQCDRFLNHLASGWVCYRCKLAEFGRRTNLTLIDQNMYRGSVDDGWSSAKGTLACTYLCRCGKAVAGDHSTRQWARCVVCERVVERKGGAEKEGERAGEKAGEKEAVVEESGEKKKKKKKKGEEHCDEMEWVETASIDELH